MQKLSLSITLGIFCLFFFISDSTAEKFFYPKNEKIEEQNKSLRSVRKEPIIGFSSESDIMRETIANCSQQFSQMFGLNQFESIFTQNLTANFITPESAFPAGAEVFVSTFCNALTSTISPFVAAGQKILSFTPLGTILGNYSFSGDSQNYSIYNTRNIAESLIGKIAEYGKGSVNVDKERKLQDIETFVSEAQNVINQLGQNIGSMFGIGAFDTAMANSFLEGFLGTLGTNSNVAGVFTDTLDQLFKQNSFQVSHGIPQIPVLSQLANGFVNN